MTRVAVRLARLEAAVPTPVPTIEYDRFRFTAAQIERMAAIQPRYLEVGLEGLSDREVEELAEIAEAVKTAGPPTTAS